MTIPETPDTITSSAPETAVVSSSSDLNLSLRRRRITAAHSDGALPKLASKTTVDDHDVPSDVSRENKTITDSAAAAVTELATLKTSNLKVCVANNINNNNNNNNKIENRGCGGPDIRLSYYRPSVPAHRSHKESPLSSDLIFKQSHAGLFNLCIVVLVAVNSRLIIENLMKYGWLIRTNYWFSSRSLKDWPLFMCCASCPVFPLAAFLVEKLAYRKYLSAPIVIFLNVIITSAALLYPIFVILSCDSSVISGINLMLVGSIVWLKLVSYAHTNYDMREVADSIDKGDASNTLSAEYFYDVSFKSLVYFMVAPTLCYQPVYPRTASVRKGWVFRQFVKLIIFTGFMGFIIEQYINPIVQNSQHPFKGNFLHAIERILKLSVPNLYLWLCMFYCFFHLWLNILAELLRFGDREFYKDWWNAKTVEEYWRMWNMPVHKWMVRHVYFPCLRHKIPKGVAMIVAFMFSAVFHELCIAVPCHVFKLWAAFGIMFQVPLVVITNYLQRKFRSSMVGNMVFWFFFCILGQPVCLLLYYHDMMNREGKVESV